MRSEERIFQVCLKINSRGNIVLNYNLTEKEAKDAIDNLRKYGRLGDYYLTKEIDKEMDMHEMLDY